MSKLSIFVLLNMWFGLSVFAISDLEEKEPCTGKYTEVSQYSNEFLKDILCEMDQYLSDVHPEYSCVTWAKGPSFIWHTSIPVSVDINGDPINDDVINEHDFLEQLICKKDALISVDGYLQICTNGRLYGYGSDDGQQIECNSRGPMNVDRICSQYPEACAKNAVSIA